jgi:hypothetical protein
VTQIQFRTSSGFYHRVVVHLQVALLTASPS